MGWSSSKISSGIGGGNVESVTGLATDDTDPQNPVVDLAVDITLRGTGTLLSPLGVTSLNGSFFSANNQNCLVASQENPILIENTEFSNGVSVVSDRDIIFTQAGVYLINVSAEFFHNAPFSSDSAFIWLKKNGSNIDFTTRISKLNSTVNNVVLSVSYLVEINATILSFDSIGVYWTADSTDIILQSQGFIIADYPNSPSVIVNVCKI